MNTHPEPLCYSIADACRVTSIGRTKLYALLKNNEKIINRNYFAFGGRTLIPAASLRRLIEGEAA